MKLKATIHCQIARSMKPLLIVTKSTHSQPLKNKLVQLLQMFHSTKINFLIFIVLFLVLLHCFMLVETC